MLWQFSYYIISYFMYLLQDKIIFAIHDLCMINTVFLCFE